MEDDDDDSICGGVGMMVLNDIIRKKEVHLQVLIILFISNHCSTVHIIPVMVSCTHLKIK